MPKVDEDRPAAIDNLLGECRNDVRQLASLQAERIVLLHETFAARIDQTGAMRDGHVVAGKIEFLQQYVECTAERELHIHEASTGTKRHRGAIPAIVVDAMRALHRDHASRHDRPLGFYRDESPRIDVEPHGAGDAGLRWPLAIGSQ